MKKSKTLFLLVLLQAIPFSSYAAFILEGEQAVYDFRPSDFVETTVLSVYSISLTLVFANILSADGLYNGQLEAGESMQMDWYNNIGDVDPFTFVLNGQDPVIPGQVYMWGDSSNPSAGLSEWTDLEGRMVYTMLSGEVYLNDPVLNVTLNGTGYVATIPSSPVPLPPSLPLFLMSISSFFAFQFKRRKNLNYCE